MATMQTLVDNFDSNSLSANWTVGGAGTAANQVKNVNGQIEITTTGVSGNYDYLISAATYDLTGSYGYVRIVSAGGQAANFDYLPLLFQDVGGTNALWWDISGNTLAAVQKASGSQTTLLTAAYVAAQHRFVRIRESAGTTYWDYSTDGRAWFNFTSAANPITVTALNALIETGQFGTASADTSKTDNFNFRGTFYVNNPDLRPHPFSPGIAR